jgi:tetratricopeptide (TPR) repeat protein
VEANPGSLQAFSALGQAHIRRRDYEAAQAAFERQIELARGLDDPIQARRWEASGFNCLAWVWDHLARRAEETGNRRAATTAAERSVEYGGKAQALDTTAEPSIQGWLPEWLAFLGREEEALREIRRYVRTMEAAGRPPAHEKIGDALDRLGRREEALEYFQRWLAATPLDPRALGHLRDACDALGRRDEAAFWGARAQAMRKSSGPQPERWLPPP